MSRSVVVEVDISDRAKIERLLSREPVYTGFLLSDLEYGNYSSDFAQIYGEMEEGELKSVLVAFQDKSVYYSPYDRAVDSYVPLIHKSRASKLVGKRTSIDKFVPFLDVMGHSDCYVDMMNRLPSEAGIQGLLVKKLTTREEAARLHDLFVQVDEYGFTGTDKETYVELQMKHVTHDSIRTYFAEVSGEMVSTAAYLNDRPRTAIVIGVATPPRHRKKGYSCSVLHQLCSDAVREGKVLYLFYTNPEAGSVYRRVGFHEGGEWKVIHLRW